MCTIASKIIIVIINKIKSNIILKKRNESLVVFSKSDNERFEEMCITRKLIWILAQTLPVSPDISLSICKLSYFYIPSIDSNWGDINSGP